MTQTHDEVQDLVAAYAVGAVDLAEVDGIRAHLDVCDACHAEFEGYLDTAAVLAGDESAVSGAVWDRIVAEIRTTREGVAAPVVPLATRERRMRFPMLFAAAVAAALVGLVGFGLGRSIAGTDDPLQAAIAEVRDQADSLEVTLTGDAGNATIVYSGSEGTGYLVSDSLPALPESRTYQLWAVTQGGVISAGVFGPDPDALPFQVSGAVNAFVLTEENAGGVVTSEGTVVAAWEQS